MFLNSWSPPNFDRLNYADDLVDHNVVFRLDGEHTFLHQRPAAEAIWARHLLSSGAETGICLVTGEAGPIARLHPAIKGVPGAQSSGASIVSFTSTPSRHMARTRVKTHLCPIVRCTLMPQRSTPFSRTARGWTQKPSVPNGRTAFRLATQRPCSGPEAAGGPQAKSRAEKAEHLFATLLDPPTDEQEASKLQQLLRLVEQGRPLEELDPALDKATRFYVLGLSPNAARLSVRFFLRSTLGELIAHGAEHLRDLSLTPPVWTTPPAAWRLLRETAVQNELGNVSPALAGEVARAILTGARYPQSLLSQTIMRVRADGEINGLRAAIAKACIARSHRKDIEQNSPDPEEDVPVALDRNETNPGYRLGRLFYVLENAQRLGIGRVNATIRDQFYGSASANPARVFPLLLRGAQDHIGAVRRKSGGGLAFWLDEQIAEIVGGLSASAPFPSTLRLEDQGQFLVGYYHQRNAAKTEGKHAEDLSETNDEE